MTLELGDNYKIEENSNGNLEITDADGTPLLRHDNSADKLIALDPIEVSELIDGADISHTGELADVGDAVGDHGNLSGLGDDDHTQYLLVDGTRALTGALDVGSNGITNGGTVDGGEYQIGGSTIAQSVVASGQVSLSSGSATVATGVTATDATFYVAIGVDDPGSDVAGLAAQLDLDSSAGEYDLTIKETGTSQNPTVNYDIVRVR